MSQDVISPARVNEIRVNKITGQAARRRTFAVISHPDAGKSTLTEALALHAKVIGTAGATNGKSNRKDTISDWMQMEKDRGISISSAALQFSYRDTVINLLDTPGHADFSEDTYRVLAAVDCAVMLVDAAKGLETQTMKLFEVCRQRGLPIITVINKWDRPGLDTLALMDEITERTGLLPMPLTWAVGIAGDFRGVWDLKRDRFVRFTRNNSGANIALTEYYTPAEAAVSEGDVWTDAVDEAGLVLDSNLSFDPASFYAGKATPILFSSAALNFGVKELLDTLVDFAPPAAPRPDVAGALRPVAAPFSGFVFKVQAGMNQAHRDHVAFVRVCSGIFERGMVVTQTRTGKSFATKYAQQVFGREREVIDEAFPGDVVGLVNASALRVGDSLYLEDPVEFPAIPLFAPEHFQVARSKDPSRYKQFRRGIDQLEHEGVIQVLRSDLRGDQAPVLAAVGPMQFEVVEDRMTHDFNAPMRFERLPYTLARLTTAEAVDTLGLVHGAEVLVRSDGEYLALFNDVWALRRVEKNNPDLTLLAIGTQSRSGS
ncbi:peptide chain release factor 3 [Paenarthrobacter sp. PH39-S1]|uniref:peptide chain release factor 3 n=1 Tax=Paenarthrobacter sp. PH39-S1 TaxID=3046204 RepID=UPI0024B9F422|nr:peptide chain release factor 3 [Paenarthrobacter sp. PH39-S1]MDJ0357047.1 peptide chain release factor 3 [Paenarthrobacter sp. PH39-S1]